MNIQNNNIALEFISTLLPQNSQASKINPEVTVSNSKFYYLKILARILMLCSMALILLSACKKEVDLIPSPGNTNSNDVYLKVGAPTYYLSPSGSDAAIGDITHPWKTLAFACSRATTPGNIIHVNAGTYNETARANLAIGVSIVGEGDASIIKYSYVASATNDASIYLNSAATPIAGNQSISNLKLDGNSLTATVAISVNYRTNVAIHHVTIVDFKNIAIRFNGDNSNPSAPTIPYSTGNSIYDCTITNCATSQNYGGAYGADQVVLLGQDGFLFYNNTQSAIGRAVGYNGKLIGANWNKGLKIYNNTFTKNNSEGTEWLFFFETWHWAGGGEIYNNTFNGAAGLDIADVRKGTYSYGIKIYDNTFQISANTLYNSHMHTPITLEDHGAIQYVYIYNNHFKNTPNGIKVVGLLDETDTKVNIDHIYIYSNLFENIGSTDVNWGFPIMFTTTGTNKNVIWDNISIYNNTLTSYAARKTYAGIYWNVGGAITNVSIRNNIIQGFATYPISFLLGIGGSTINTLSVENNLYYINNYGNAANYGTVAINNKTEQHNLVGNPLFISTSDYHLNSGSPAINAGINVGLPYNSTVPDIGSFESGSTSPNNVASSINNQAPIIQNQAFQLSKSASNGKSVGNVIATEPDAGQALTYSILSGNTNNAFAVNSSTGVITVANSAALLNGTAGTNYSIFSSTTPSITQNVKGSGASPIEVGMKFRSRINGYISGFRFYKGAGAQGTHIGNLWSIDGVNLASATFTNETTSGWQTVTLSSPVAITANTIYVVSYFSQHGDYVKTNPYFSADIVNGPLTAQGWTVAQHNGVYKYSSTSVFPDNNTYVGNTNYWTDVIFSSSITTSSSFSLTIKVQDNGTGSLSSQAKISISII